MSVTLQRKLQVESEFGSVFSIFLYFRDMFFEFWLWPTKWNLLCACFGSTQNFFTTYGVSTHFWKKSQFFTQIEIPNVSFHFFLYFRDLFLDSHINHHEEFQIVHLSFVLENKVTLCSAITHVFKKIFWHFFSQIKISNVTL